MISLGHGPSPTRSTLKFLHAADLHIDSPMRGLDAYEGAPLETLRGATRRALTRLVDLAIEEEVGFVLLAGDLYDGSWKDYSTGLFFIKEMGRLEQAKIPVYCLYGNHDAEAQLGKKLRLPSNVHAFDHRAPQTFTDEALRIAVHGQSFAKKAVLEDLAADYPEAKSGLLNIGLLHTGLEGRPGHGAYAPTSLDVLRGKGYGYWALGHIHKREVVCEEPWVVFPGNLQGRHVRECGPKGASLVTYDDVGIQSVEHRDLDSVRWEILSLDATDCDSGHELLDRIGSMLEAALDEAEPCLLAARIEIRGTCAAHRELSADPDHWISEIRSLGLQVGPGTLFLERIKLLTKAPLDLEALREREDPTGCVARRLLQLQTDEQALAAFSAGLAEDLAGLLRKLPPEAQSDEEGAKLCDPASVGSALEEVEQLLLMRLGQGERA